MLNSERTTNQQSTDIVYVAIENKEEEDVEERPATEERPTAAERPTGQEEAEQFIENLKLRYTCGINDIQNKETEQLQDELTTQLYRFVADLQLLLNEHPECDPRGKLKKKLNHESENICSYRRDADLSPQGNRSRMLANFLEDRAKLTSVLTSIEESLQDATNERVVLVAICGDRSVGKTTLIETRKKSDNRASGGVLDRWESLRYETLVKFDRETVRLCFLDADCQEECNAMLQDLWIEESEIFVFMYSVADKSTLDEYKSLWERIRSLKGPDTPLVLVGNKIDLAQLELHVQQLQQDALQVKEELGAIYYLEMSATDEEFVKRLCQRIARISLDCRQDEDEKECRFSSEVKRIPHTTLEEHTIEKEWRWNMFWKTTVLWPLLPLILFVQTCFFTLFWSNCRRFVEWFKRIFGSKIDVTLVERRVMFDVLWNVIDRENRLYFLPLKDFFSTSYKALLLRWLIAFAAIFCWFSIGFNFNQYILHRAGNPHPNISMIEYIGGAAFVVVVSLTTIVSASRHFKLNPKLNRTALSKNRLSFEGGEHSTVFGFQHKYYQEHDRKSGDTVHVWWLVLSVVMAAGYALAPGTFRVVRGLRFLSNNPLVVIFGLVNNFALSLASSILFEVMYTRNVKKYCQKMDAITCLLDKNAAKDKKRNFLSLTHQENCVSWLELRSFFVLHGNVDFARQELFVAALCIVDFGLILSIVITIFTMPQLIHESFWSGVVGSTILLWWIVRIGDVGRKIDEIQYQQESMLLQQMFYSNAIEGGSRSEVLKTTIALVKDKSMSPRVLGCQLTKVLRNTLISKVLSLVIAGLSIVLKQ